MQELQEMQEMEQMQEMQEMQVAMQPPGRAAPGGRPPRPRP